MGWGFILTCFALFLCFYVLDLIFAVIQLSSSAQNAIEMAYALGTLSYLAWSLALAVRIILGRSDPLR